MNAASPSDQTGLRPLSLGVGLLIMLGASVYPFVLAGPSGQVDHVLVLAAFWAMSAGLVHGVGFTPLWWGWRWLFSGWACLLALGLVLTRWLG